MNTGRLIYIDPNDLAAENERRHEFTNGTHPYNITYDYEDLSVGVDLEVMTCERGGNVIANDISDNSTNNLFTNKNGSKLSVVMYDKNKEAENIKDGYLPTGKNNGNNKEYFFLTSDFAEANYDDLSKGFDAREAMCIESINIDYSSNMTPEVTMNLVDIRGLSLFQPEELQDGMDKSAKNVTSNVFRALVRFPYPLFRLSIKGFYGTKVTYSLAPLSFKTTFDNGTGNFKIAVKFIGHIYGLYTDIMFNYLLAAPYFDSTEKGVPGKYWSENKNFVYNEYGNTGATTNEASRLMTFIEFANRWNEVKKNAESFNNDFGEVLQRMTDLKQAQNKIQQIVNVYNNFLRAISDNSVTYDPASHKDYDETYYAFFPLTSTTSPNSETILGDKDKIISYHTELSNLIKEFNEANGSEEEGEGFTLPEVTLPELRDDGYIDLSEQPFFVKEGDELKENSEADEVLNTDEHQTLLKAIRNDEAHKATWKYYLYEHKCFFKTCNETFEKIDNKCKELANSEDRNKEEGRLSRQILGFYPTIENVFRMLFAHLDCFMHFYYECLDNIKNANNDRTASALGLLEEEGTIKSDIPKGNGDVTVPPFTKFFRNDNNGSMEEIYPGDIEKYAELDECKFVDTIIGSLLMLEHEENTVEAESGNTDDTTTYSEETALPKFRANLLTDYMLDKNPYAYLKTDGSMENRIGSILYVYLKRYMAARMHFQSGSEWMAIREAKNVAEVFDGSTTFNAMLNGITDEKTLSKYISDFCNSNGYDVLNPQKEKDEKSSLYKASIIDIDNGGKDGRYLNNTDIQINPPLRLYRKRTNEHHVHLPLKMSTPYVNITTKKEDVARKLKKIKNLVENIQNESTAEKPKKNSEDRVRYINTSMTAVTSAVDDKVFYPYRNETVYRIYEYDGKVVPKQSEFKKGKKYGKYSNLVEACKKAEGSKNKPYYGFIFPYFPPAYYRFLYSTTYFNEHKGYHYHGQFSEGGTLKLYNNFKALMFLKYMNYGKKTIESAIEMLNKGGHSAIYRLPRHLVALIGGCIYAEEKNFLEKYGLEPYREFKKDDSFLLMYNTEEKIARLNRSEMYGDLFASKDKYEGERNALKDVFEDFAEHEYSKIEKLFFKSKVFERAKQITGNQGMVFTSSHNSWIDGDKKDDFNNWCNIYPILKGQELHNKITEFYLSTCLVECYKNEMTDSDKKVIMDYKGRLSVKKTTLLKFVEELKKLYADGGTTQYESGVSTSLKNDEEINVDIRYQCYNYLQLLYNRWIPMYDKERFLLSSPDEVIEDRRKRFSPTSSGDNNQNGYMVSNSNDVRSQREFTNFLFVDSYYNDISSRFYINPQTLYESIRQFLTGQNTVNVLSFMSSLCQNNRLNFISLPIYSNFYNTETVKDMFLPKTYNDEYRKPSYGNTYLIMYPYATSENLISEGRKEGCSFAKDDIMLSISRRNGVAEATLKDPDTQAIFTTKDVTDNNELQLNVPVFGVEFGRQNQSYFTDVQINMDTGSATEEEIKNTFAIANTAKEGSNTMNSIIYGNDLFQVYSKRAYTCNVRMMGCANIMPMMCFYLNNIPMFKGLYMITKVSHNITPGNMTTSFTGVKVAKYKTKYIRNVFNFDYLSRMVANKLNGGGGYIDDGTVLANCNGYDVRKLTEWLNNRKDITNSTQKNVQHIQEWRYNTQLKDLIGTLINMGIGHTFILIKQARIGNESYISLRQIRSLTEIHLTVTGQCPEMLRAAYQ